MNSLEEALNTLKLSGIEADQRYQHYATKATYVVVGVGLDEKTLQPVVIYKPVDQSAIIWVRALKDFTAVVQYQGTYTPRFLRVFPLD